jgi:hypothetical protein
MITHVIYHIPGRKVGCTKDLTFRKWWYQTSEGSLPNGMEILEELHDKTNEEAGDIEWQWADRLGYRRGKHYTLTTAVLFPERSRDLMRKRGKNGGLKAAKLGYGFQNSTREQQVDRARRGAAKGGRRCAELGLTGYQNLTFEQRSAAGRKGSQKRDTCPHCGMITNVMNLNRWHNDNCPRRKKIRFVRGT